MPESQLAKTLRRLIKDIDQLVRDLQKDGTTLKKDMEELEDLRRKSMKEDKEGDGKS